MNMITNYNEKKMKTPKKPVTLGSIPLMPESLRKAFELAAAEAWILANTIVEAIWREKLDVLKNQAIEAEQVRVAQIAEILNLRKRLASSEEAGERASSLAKEEAAKASLQIAILSDSTRRAAANAANISTLVEDLMTNLRPTAASRAPTPPPEIQFEPETPDSPHDHVQRSSTEDADGVDSSSPRSGVTAELRTVLLREQSEILAAVAALIKVICRFHGR